MRGNGPQNENIGHSARQSQSQRRSCRPVAQTDEQEEEVDEEEEAELEERARGGGRRQGAKDDRTHLGP